MTTKPSSELEVTCLRDENAALWARITQLEAENEVSSSFAEERDKFARWAGAELDDAHEETLRLRAALVQLRAENERLREALRMACAMPADDCDCSGCSYAARHVGT